MFDVTNLEGFGLSVSGFAAAGPKGVSGQVFGSAIFNDSGAIGELGGVAVGAGASISGQLTFAREVGRFDLNSTPEKIRRVFQKFSPSRSDK